LLLNIAFFLTIDKKYIKTFFGKKTAPQYTCELFSTSVEDSAKFRAVYKNRISYTKAVHDDVQVFVSNNIVRWMAEKPKWFKIEKIDDDFLTADLFEAQGGAQRRRSSIFLELAGLETNEKQRARRTNRNTVHRQANKAWKKIAEDIYKLRSKEFVENVSVIASVFGENVVLLKPLIDRCPAFATILAHVLLNKMGFRAQDVDWREEESKRVRQSFAKNLRQRKTGEVAVDAWRKQYSQLEILFK